MSEMKWDEKVKEKFLAMVADLPQFHRTIAQRLVKQTAESIAQKRGADAVQEKDMLTAFCQEVPPAYRAMMERLFRKHNIDCACYLSDASICSTTDQ